MLCDKMGTSGDQIGKSSDKIKIKMSDLKSAWMIKVNNLFSSITQFESL